MPFSVAERNASINETAGRMTHVTLYSGSPEAGGTEVAGISRAAVPGWTVANDGARSLTSPVDITVPAGSTFDHVAFMNASTGGTVRGYISVARSTFGDQGTYTIQSGTIGFPVS